MDEGLLDTSAALMRVERIGKEYRVGMVNLRQARRDGDSRHSGGKAWRKLTPDKQKELASYTSAIQRTGQHESDHQRLTGSCKWVSRKPAESCRRLPESG